MGPISIKSRVRADGLLHLDVPTGLRDTDVDVILVVKPVDGDEQTHQESPPWPEGFIEQTFGCLADDPLPVGRLLR